MVARLHKGGHTFLHDLDGRNFVALPVQVLTDLVELGSEVLAHYGEELGVFHTDEEGVRIEGLLVHSDGHADLQLRGQLLYEVAQLCYGHLTIVVERLLDLVVQFAADAVLVLQAVEVEHFFSERGIGLVHGLENGGEGTGKHGEYEATRHHHDDEVDLLHPSFARHVAIPDGGHGRGHEVERDDVLFMDP